MTGRNAAALADYIIGIALPLSSKLEELFAIEVQPIIDVAATPHERAALQDGWQVVVNSHTGSRRFFEKGKITLGKERVCSILLRQLRSLQCVAVGQVEVTGALGVPEIIEPRMWESLIVTWGSNTTTGQNVVLREVYVALTDRLGEARRRDLNNLLYGLSVKRAPASLAKGGRPAHQREMVMAWLREKQAHGKLPKEEAARAQALEHFRSQIAEGKISEQTIRRVVKAFYDDHAEPRS